jgi:hypothetical protein
MILDGYANGRIQYAEAIYLFTLHKDVAGRYFFPDYFQTVFADKLNPVGLLNTPISLNDAQNLRPWKALILYWDVFGFAQGLLICTLYKSTFTEHFVSDMLIGREEDFPDDVLANIRQEYEGKQVSKLAYAALQKRLGHKARAHMKNPTDINKDVQAVKERITEYKFTPELNEILDKIADELAAGGDKFDQAASLKHLRTFFEKLHEQVGTSLRNAKSDIKDRGDLSKFGQAIDYLERNTVLTPKMKELPRSLYGILSNEGVHAFKSEKEYVRLCRNMVIEYAIVLFYELDVNARPKV